MKTVLRTDGWDRIVTERHEITAIANFQGVAHWVDFHERHPQFKGNGRIHCSCCGKAWKSLEASGNVWICMMKRGVNQCICDSCVENFRHLVIRESRDKTEEDESTKH